VTGRRGALQYLYIVASAAVPKYNLFLIIELIAWMSPKQALPTNYIISIYIVIYDVPRCANTWLNFRSRETTLFKARLRRIEGRDLARFGSICLVSILPGTEAGMVDSNGRAQWDEDKVMMFFWGNSEAANGRRRM
jgi:hypothetical protein